MREVSTSVSAERFEGLTVYNGCKNRQEARSDTKMHLIKEIFLKEQMSPLKIVYFYGKRFIETFVFIRYLDLVKYISLSFSTKEIVLVP